MPEFAINLVGFVLTAGAIYGGIRSDLRNMAARVARVESVADKAHERIDNMLTSK